MGVTKGSGIEWRWKKAYLVFDDMDGTGICLCIRENLPLHHPRIPNHLLYSLVSYLLC